MRFTKRLGVFGITVSLFAGGLTAAAFPGVAHASCKGYLVQDYETFRYNGVLRAEEWAVDGTCNDNDYYQGHLNDSAADHRYVALKLSPYPCCDWKTVARAGGQYGNNIQYGFHSPYHSVMKFCLIVEPGYTGEAICSPDGFETFGF